MQTLSWLVPTFLLNVSWQVTLVAAVAVLGAWILRDAPARYRHALWVAALGLCVLLPLSALRGGNPHAAPAPPLKATPPGPLRPLSSVAPAVIPPAHVVSGHRDVVADFSARDWPVRLPAWLGVVMVGGYFLALLLHLTRLGRAWRRTSEIRRSARPRPLPAWMASDVWRCQLALGVSKVTILCSPHVAGPVALGVRRPTIILPERMFEQSSPEDLTSTLCHELAHIRRHDFLMNLVYEFLYTLIFFHPAAALIKRRISQTRELACDEMAAGRIVSASAYARSLVNQARAVSGLPPVSDVDYTLGVFDADILEERVMRLLDQKPRAGARLAKLVLTGVLSSLTLVGMAATLFSLSVTEKSGTATPNGPHPDFSGHWKLDKTASTLPPSSPDDLVEVIDHRDPQLRITTTSKDWSGDFWLNVQKPIALTLFALTIPEWVATTDGIERTEKYGPAELKSKTHWEDDRLITAWSLERDGRPEIIGEWVRSLSADGRTQFLEVKAHDPQRAAKGEAKLVFVKSSAESAESFVGTWQAEFQGKTFMVVELRREGDKLTGTMSPFTIELDEAGNLTRAERGDHGGWDVIEAQNWFRTH